DARARLRQADLENRYARGVELLQKAQWREAIRAFTAIEQEEPGYRDTPALISAAQKLDETTGSQPVSPPPAAAETPPPNEPPSLVTGSPRRRRPSAAVVAGAAGVVALV